MGVVALVDQEILGCLIEVEQEVADLQTLEDLIQLVLDDPDEVVTGQRTEDNDVVQTCLLYTSDAADNREVEIFLFSLFF